MNFKWLVSEGKKGKITQLFLKITSKMCKGKKCRLVNKKTR